jgi:hypothetical protein
MKRAFLLHGLKRSGNHAVINWLLGTNSFAFHNNIIPIAKILTGEKDMPAPLPLKSWLARRHALPFWETWKARNKDLLITLEDHPVDLSPFTDLPEDARNILILRDPYNLFASRIRKASLVDNASYQTEPGPLFDRAIIRWKEHAREFLGDTKVLKNLTTIYFDRWFQSEPYRRAICAGLGLEFSDITLSKVSDHGGGSSFDLSSFDNKASQMNVLNRVASLTEKERQLFSSIENDTEIAELQKRIQSTFVQS